jgi:hypothetical protein
VSFFLCIGLGGAVATETKPATHIMPKTLTSEELVAACKGKLLTDEELAAALGTGFTPRSIATLRRAGKINYIRIGYRTIRYNLQSVLASLGRREVKAVGTRAAR